MFAPFGDAFRGIGYPQVTLALWGLAHQRLSMVCPLRGCDCQSRSEAVTAARCLVPPKGANHA